jgi:hypothetical protein
MDVCMYACMHVCLYVIKSSQINIWSSVSAYQSRKCNHQPVRRPLNMILVVKVAPERGSFQNEQWGIFFRQELSLQRPSQFASFPRTKHPRKHRPSLWRMLEPLHPQNMLLWSTVSFPNFCYFCGWWCEYIRLPQTNHDQSRPFAHKIWEFATWPSFDHHPRHCWLQVHAWCACLFWNCHGQEIHRRWLMVDLASMIHHYPLHRPVCFPQQHGL